MEITDVKAEICRFLTSNKEVWATFVRIYTDEDIIGTFPFIANYLYPDLARHKMVKIFIEKVVKPELVGADPFHIEKLSYLMNTVWCFRYHNFRPWPIEIALWDIVGKASKLPIYKLLGGFRDKVKAYVSTALGKTPEERVKDVIRWLEKGYKAVKLRARWYRPPQKFLDVVKAIRDAVGNDIEIMVDANQAYQDEPPFWTRRTALMMARELEKYDVVWLEEPLFWNDLEGLAELCRAVDIPIMGGELEIGLYRFKELLEKGVYDIINPDVTLSGGILQVRKIAALAEAWGKLCQPHSCCNGAILAANLQLIGAIPNCHYVEFFLDTPHPTIEERDIMLKDPILIDKEGYVKIPSKPGIGVEFNEELIASSIVRVST